LEPAKELKTAALALRLILVISLTTLEMPEIKTEIRSSRKKKNNYQQNKIN
jgi:hypothetical protein